jgi:hypothetical protein
LLLPFWHVFLVALEACWCWGYEVGEASKIYKS